MAREVQISQASPLVEARAETAQYEALQGLGNTIQNSINIAGNVYKQAQNALTNSQVRKNGNLLEEEWNTFYALNRNNLNEDTFRNLSNNLYNEQLNRINNDADLTGNAKKTLSDNLELTRKTIERNYIGNIAQVQAQAALNNTNELIAQELRNQKVDPDTRRENAASIYRDGVKDGIYSGDANSEAIMLNYIDTEIRFYQYEDDIQKIFSGDEESIAIWKEKGINRNFWGKKSEVSRQDLLGFIADEIDGNKKLSDSQKDKLLTQATQSLKGLVVDQEDYIALLNKKINSNDPSDMPSLEDIYQIDNVYKRNALISQRNSVLYKQRETEEELERKIVAARGQIYSDISSTGDIKQQYFGYSPAWEGKSEKTNAYEMSPREHENIFEYNMTILESQGRILGFVDDKVYTGKRAIDEMWHEITAIKNEELRNLYIDKLTNIIKTNPSIGYKVETDTINSMPKDLRPYANMLNTYMQTNIERDLGINVGRSMEWRTAYSRAMKHLYDTYRLEGKKALSDDNYKAALKNLRMMEMREKQKNSMINPNTKSNAIRWGDIYNGY